MNLKQLEYFVQVAELGSFSKAAAVLDVAQPALSRQVRALESDLAEYLFVRNGRGVALTEAGRRLFDHSVTILQSVAQARQDLGASRDAPAGKVTIGLPPSIGRVLTVPLIDRFKRDFPAARLAVVEGLSTHIVEWVTSGRIDVGLVYNPEAQQGLDIAPLHKEALALVSPTTRSRKSAGGHGTPLPLAELAGYPLIVPERVHAMRRLLETQSAFAGIKLDIAWEVSSIPSIIDLVRAGYGHAVLTASGVQALAGEGVLSVRPLTDPQIMSVLCLVSAANKRPTALARRSKEMIEDLVAERLGTGAQAIHTAG